jgi:hypothetical protein
VRTQLGIAAVDGYNYGGRALLGSDILCRFLIRGGEEPRLAGWSLATLGMRAGVLRRPWWRQEDDKVMKRYGNEHEAVGRRRVIDMICI